jgi:hypothetical protein
MRIQSAIFGFDSLARFADVFHGSVMSVHCFTSVTHPALNSFTSVLHPAIKDRWIVSHFLFDSSLGRSWPSTKKYSHHILVSDVPNWRFFLDRRRVRVVHCVRI